MTDISIVNHNLIKEREKSLDISMVGSGMANATISYGGRTYDLQVTRWPIN